MRKILGVDLASAVAGVVLMDQDMGILHSSRLSTSKMTKTHSKWERYFILLSPLVELIQDHRDGMESIVIEGYAFTQPTALIPAVECGTVFRVLLEQLSLLDRLMVVPPTSLKKFVTGSGAAKKDMMIAKVHQKYGWMPPDSDQADAYGLAVMGYHAKSSAPLLVYEREVLEKLGVYQYR